MGALSVRRATVFLLAVVVAGLVGVAVPQDVAGDPALSDRFRYKFPCGPGGGCWVTQTQHVNNALDFDIGGSAYDGTIRAMSEGTVVALNEPYPECTWPYIHTLGRWVIVQDVASRATVYGHMAESYVGVEDYVLQGDALGVEGNAGYSADCEVHLHWEPGGSLPEYIDDHLTSSLCAPCEYESTNSRIGGFSGPDLAIRDKYFAIGVAASNWSWNVVGWTANASRGLDVHGFRTWGWEQNFRHDPDAWGREWKGIYVGVWSPAVAYYVDSPFWQAWEFGAWVSSQYWSISIPRADIGGCPPGSDPICLFYQRFHLGYIWMDTYTGVEAVWCPDVFGDDYAVNIIGDVAAVLEYAGTYQGGPPNANGKYYDPWYDMDGDGAITIVTDVLLVVAASGYYCYPGGSPD